MIGAERNLQLAQSTVDSLKKRLKRLESLETQGKIYPIETQHLQYTLEAAQAELRFALLEKAVLERMN